MEANAQGPRLAGKRVAVLMTDGVEQVEYTRPREFLEQHGAQVVLVSPKEAGEEVQGFNALDPGDKFKVDISVRNAREQDFDMLLLPGGTANPHTLRQSQESLAFIKAFADEQKLIAAICHGPWPLIEAGVAKAKHLTSWPSIQRDLINAGAEWSDDEVVVDGRLITSRKPDDLPAFNKTILEALAVDPAKADTGASS